MKKINVFLTSLLVAGVIFSGCKKDEEDPLPDPGTGSTCTTVISAEEQIYDDGVNPKDTTHKVYIYNSNKKLVKITSAYNSYPVSQYDTIVYNGSEIVSVRGFTIGNPTPYYTNTYTYTSGRISSVHEVGDNGSPYDRVRTFTYNGSGQLSSQTVVYTVGANGGGPEDITSITYTGNNPTSVDLGISYGGPATLVVDLTAPNPYLGLNYDSEDILMMFAANNITSVYSNAAPGSPFFTRTYTYAGGRVSKFVETDGGGGETTTTITYGCI